MSNLFRGAGSIVSIHIDLPRGNLFLSAIRMAGEDPEQSNAILTEVKQLFDEGANSNDPDRSIRRYRKCIALSQPRSMPTPYDLFR
jgi:hypothetical protein